MLELLLAEGINQYRASNAKDVAFDSDTLEAGMKSVSVQDGVEQAQDLRNAKLDARKNAREKAVQQTERDQAKHATQQPSDGEEI